MLPIGACALWSSKEGEGGLQWDRRPMSQNRRCHSGLRLQSLDGGATVGLSHWRHSMFVTASWAATKQTLPIGACAIWSSKEGEGGYSGTDAPCRETDAAVRACAFSPLGGGGLQRVKRPMSRWCHAYRREEGAYGRTVARCPCHETGAAVRACAFSPWRGLQ